MRNLIICSIIFFFLFLIGCVGNKAILKINAKEDSSLKETQYYKLFTDATKHALFGNFQSAIPLYQACIDLFPERAAPYYQLSSIFVRSKNPSDAVKFAEKSFFLDSSNVWYAVNLANIYQYLGYLDSASLMYENVIRKKPDDEMRYNLAMIYSQTGKYDKAEVLLKKINERNPESLEVILMQHNIFNEKRVYDSAIYQLELLTKYFPDDINNYGILAEYLSEVGQREYARRVYNNMLKLDSTNGMSMISFAKFYFLDNIIDSAFYFYNKAFTQSDLKYEDKIDLLVNQLNNKEFLKNNNFQLLELANTINKKERNFSYYTVCGDIYLNTENYDSAKIYLDSAIIFEKFNYNLWEQALLVNSFLNDNNEVLRIADECLIYFRDKPSVFMFKAYAQKGLGMNDSTIENARKIESLNPGKQLILQSYLLLAETYREKGINEISDSYFEKILVIEPLNLPVRNNYAYYLALREVNLQKARELSKLTIEQEPENATYLDTYGWVLFKSGKLNEAKEFIEKAIKYGAFNNAEVIDHYGDVMKALNRCHDAIEAYERVMEIDSKYSVERKIQELKVECK
jgi:tetratricopeptide (TPR) repeat protein